MTTDRGTAAGPGRDGAQARGRGAKRRAVGLLAGSAALLTASVTCGGLAALAPGTAAASSHREAPLISGQPAYDNTDLYAFVSPDRPDTTTLIANWNPFEEPAGGPNFFPFAEDARHQFHIDATGDGRSELIYRFTFTTHVRNGDTFLYNTGPVTSLDDPDLNVRQTFDLELLRFEHGRHKGTTKLADDAPVAPSDVGKASMPRYADLRDRAVRALPDGSTVFAGQADDPFFLDLRVFDLLYGGDLSETGDDTLAGYNVNTLALQVPSALLTAGGEDPVIGVWTTTQRRSSYGGDWTQVSRLGMPLVNEVVIPRRAKDGFNASAPWDDAQFAGFVLDPELPKLIEQIYQINAPATPRKDLEQVFLTGIPGVNQPARVRPHEALRLNTSTGPVAAPERLGALDGDNSGFPNGRRLTDDVVDISLQVVEGELTGAKSDLGDAVDANDLPFGKEFPYLALPHSGSRGADGGGSGADTRINAGRASASDSTLTESPWMLASSVTGGLALLLGIAGLLWRRRRA
ncbi:DUF4331 domain-containing protein [Streptomyces capparidis]